ncbi:MAG: single-stranded-DNA-specific exonuclease RecJ [Alphaproteobacteria bacterium]
MEPKTPAFLGVEKSFSGKRWQSRVSDDRQALALAQRLGIAEILARILVGRGIALDQASWFLDPTLRDSLPNPSQFKDMDRAAERLAAAIMGGERICIFGDYDVDGATSSAVLTRFIAAAGGKTFFYIPDRLTEGYGPNTPALQGIKAQGASLVLTADCGITAFEPIRAARDMGLDLIVVDHHEAEPSLPEAFAVINPNRLDESGAYGQLAAVGVAFLLCVATNRVLRDAGWYVERNEPDLMSLLDLVALGTICDVVPLVGLNRALARQGLKVMARRGNVGLAALSEVANIDKAPDAYHAGFVFGPRINAGGRVGEAALGARLLTTDSMTEARTIARTLDGLNRERQAVEAAVLEAATALVGKGRPGRKVIVVASAGWHPGVIGIVASRLKDRYDLPAFVISLDGETGKGSGRSIPSVDLGAIVIAARQAGLLVNGGGHRMAAGLTIEREKVGDFEAFLDERLQDRGDVTPILNLDAALSVGGANFELVQKVQDLGPFGAGNAEPRLAIADATIAYADIVGENHVRCTLQGNDGKKLKGISFRSADQAWGQALLSSGGRPLHIAGHLRLDSWQGHNRVQLVITDAAAAGGGR